VKGRSRSKNRRQRDVTQPYGEGQQAVHHAYPVIGQGQGSRTIDTRHPNSSQQRVVRHPFDALVNIFFGVSWEPLPSWIGPEWV
jgi:hypothetical protein